jgi:hypothetical protein
VSDKKTTTIRVDAQAAEILQRASARASKNGETLGSYLQHALASDAGADTLQRSQRDAWEAFVKGMTRWAKSNLPAGHVANDSREVNSA